MKVEEELNVKSASELEPKVHTDNSRAAKDMLQKSEEQSAKESNDPVNPSESSKINSAKSDEAVTEEIAEKTFPQDKTINPSKESIPATKENAVEEDISDKNSDNTLGDDTDEEAMNQTDDDSDEDTSESDTGFAEKREKQ